MTQRTPDRRLSNRQRRHEDRTATKDLEGKYAAALLAMQNLLDEHDGVGRGGLGGFERTEQTYSEARAALGAIDREQS